MRAALQTGAVGGWGCPSTALGRVSGAPARTLPLREPCGFGGAALPLGMLCHLLLLTDQTPGNPQKAEMTERSWCSVVILISVFFAGTAAGQSSQAGTCNECQR